MSLVPICFHIHESTTFAVLFSFLSSFSNLLLTLLPAPLLPLTPHSTPIFLLKRGSAAKGTVIFGTSCHKGCEEGSI